MSAELCPVCNSSLLGVSDMNKAIKKIELDLGGKVVSLTPEQAKNLKDALGDLFGKEIVREKEYVPYPQPYPVNHPLRPYWYWRDCTPNLPYYHTTCGTGTLVSNFCSSSETLKLTG